ncbi:MAG: thiamine pyrophosphate-binding protein [Deltaproteobacteria bacterium]|nr:thiamine pyrophosphate-binding protein [Deltaproteobacteria bacterium]
MSSIHGGHRVARALATGGITRIFTLPGASAQAVYDGCLEAKIEVIDLRHARSATHAADAHARVTGATGVVVVGGGSAVLDVAAALATAQQAGVPLLCLSGGPPATLRGRGAAQEVDAATVLGPVTKATLVARDPTRLELDVAHALAVARAGPAGPVFLDLPLDLLLSESDPRPVSAPAADFRPAPEARALDEVVARLGRAERPLLLAGSELRFAADPSVVRRFADQTGLPVLLNGLARGALPRAHPCLVVRARPRALAESDLVLVAGTPLDFRVDYGDAPTWSERGALIQVSADPAPRARGRAEDLRIHADPGAFLELLRGRMDRRSPGAWGEALRAEETAPAPPRAGHAELGRAVAAAIRGRLRSGDIVVGDGGSFVGTVARELALEWPELWIDAGPLGTPGIGPAFALAAALARPGARVFLVTGDGALGMHLGEWEAQLRHGARIVTVVGTDATRAQLARAGASAFGPERAVATRLTRVPHDRVAEAMGLRGHRVDDVADLDAALDAALESPGGACVDVSLPVAP